MRNPTYLGIDFGTSAARVCLIDAQEKRLLITRSPLQVSDSPLQTHESYRHRTQDPDDWLIALDHCLKALFERFPADQIDAIAVDGTSSSMLLCAPDGEALTPTLMYHDASSTTELAQLREQHPQPEIALSSTAGLPKILQLSKHVRRSALIQHQADWISGQLCGQFGFSDENNALKSGYDPAGRCWPEWVKQVIPEHLKLPDVKVAGTHIGTASPWLQEKGFHANCAIVAGTTDSTAAFVASGARNPDQGVTTLGSTLVLKQLCHEPIQSIPDGIYSHRLGDTWLTGGASNSGGNVLSHYFTPQQLNTMSLQIDPMMDSGLDYYPLTSAGERFPIHDPEKPARLTPRPESEVDFLKGILEGIARIEKRGYQRLHQLGTQPVKQVITAGGGATNQVWQMIRQRILGVPISNADETEAAYGAALLAKHGTALWDTFK